MERTDAAGVRPPEDDAVRAMRRSVVILACSATLLAVSATSGSGGRPASWRPLPQAPIEGRLAASAVWTGSDVIVWGGVARSGRTGARGDGAAFRPATGRWRRIARAPAGVLGDGGLGAAWTGRLLVVWAGNAPTGPAGGAVYDPRTNHWRKLPRGPLGPREGYVSAWTGSALVVVGGASGDAPASPTAAAVDPRTGVWRRLTGFGRIVLPVGTGAAWTGRGLFVSGMIRTASATSLSPALLRFEPRTGAVRRIGVAGAPPVVRNAQELKIVGWTGSRLVLTTGADPLYADTGVVVYDPATSVWRPAPAAPCRPSRTTYSQNAWAGKYLVVPCDSRRVQLYDPAANRWQISGTGTSRLFARGWSAIAWTGTELFVWSGTARRPGNPTPADGATLALGR